MLIPFLAVLCESLGHLFTWAKRFDVRLALQFPYYLASIHGTSIGSTDQGAICHGPVRTTTEEVIRKPRAGDSHVRVRVDGPFVAQVNTVAANDRETRLIRYIET